MGPLTFLALFLSAWFASGWLAAYTCLRTDLGHGIKTTADYKTVMVGGPFALAAVVLALVYRKLNIDERIQRQIQKYQ